MSVAYLLILLVLMLFSLWRVNSFVKSNLSWLYKPMGRLLDENLNSRRRSVQFYVCSALLLIASYLVWYGVNYAPTWAVNLVFVHQYVGLSFVLLMLGFCFLSFVMSIGFGTAEFLQTVRKKLG